MKLETSRLILRTPVLEDAPAIARAINDPRVSCTLLAVPYPYTVDDAIIWIKSSDDPVREANAQLTMFLKETGEVVGGVGLVINEMHRRGEIGYWCAVAHWGRGYTTEAASRVVRYGFEERGLERIQSFCLTTNPASAKVMEKLGMQFEGTARHEFFKDGKFGNFNHYAILKGDYDFLNRA